MRNPQRQIHMPMPKRLNPHPSLCPTQPLLQPMHSHLHPRPSLHSQVLCLALHSCSPGLRSCLLHSHSRSHSHRPHVSSVFFCPILHTRLCSVKLSFVNSLIYIN